MRYTSSISLLCLGIGLALTTGTALADGGRLTTEQRLGRALYFDENLSLNKNQSCASCHTPDSAFVDPDNTAINPDAPPLHTPVSDGSVAGLNGTRNAPSAAYALYSPFFHWDGDEGLYVGGQFWDGRAPTLADQAAGPFLNPVEMAMPDKWAVVDRLRTSHTTDYVRLFRRVYNINLDAIPPYDWSDNNHKGYKKYPLPPGVLEIYDRMAKAIGEFEKTRDFTRFSSKFDYVIAGAASFTAQEQFGREVFEGKAKCILCHLSTPTVATDGSDFPAMFTDFTYDNLGVPANLYIPGSPLPADQGLGGREDIAANDPDGNELGKFKVMSLRNIADTPPYAHNGVFQTLEEIVHFYNTRDVLPPCDPALGNTDPGFGTTCWPVAEVTQNVNTAELGNLSLSPDEEAALVAFMKTLSDGWGHAHGYPPLPAPPLPPSP